MTSLITGLIVLGSIIIGFGFKFYFGESKGEAAESVIEKVVKVETGVDLQPIFDLDNEEDPKKPA